MSRTTHLDHPREEMPEELEARMARESQEWHLSLRYGMSENDWHVYQRLTRKRNLRLWLDFLGDNVDFDYHWLLRVLQFKLNRMVDYWRRFSHLANGDYIRAQMELAVRLIDVVLRDGNECGDDEKFPYTASMFAINTGSRYDSRTLTIGTAKDSGCASLKPIVFCSNSCRRICCTGGIDFYICRLKKYLKKMKECKK